MCELCDGYTERFRVEEREYRDLLGQLTQLVEKRTFVLTASDVSLEEARHRPILSEWVTSHTFECARCARRFVLSFDGRAFSGVWEVND